MSRAASQFKKGQSGNPHGRPKGAKDSIPRSFRASIKGMYEKLATERPELFEDAITRDLQNRHGTAAFHHVQLAAHYLDGRPETNVKIGNDEEGPLLIVVKDDDE